MKSIAIILACILPWAFTSISHADDFDREIKLNIAPQPLASALLSFAEQSSIQVVTSNDDLRKYQTRGVSGRYTVRAAMAVLLDGTGLEFREVGKGTISVGRSMPLSGSPETQVMRLAENQTPSVEEPEKSAEPQEIVVTAQKREERLIDTPQSVTVFSADELNKLGATQFRDYANSVPGLNFSTSGAGYTQISMRGVTSGVDIGQTVGIYVDEVPYGSSAGFGGSAQHSLDVGLFDMQHIEVLRGPQGTLYGASAMGGLIKYVSKRPDLLDSSFEMRTGVSSTRDGGMGYNGSATFNAPLIEQRAALRLNAFYNHDGGFVDNVALGDEDANSSDVYGGRLDLVLAPSEALEVRLTAFAQNINRDGESTGDYAFNGSPLDDELDQRRLFSEPFKQQFRVISGAIDYDLAGMSLTSVSSYQTTDMEYVQDLSVAYLPFVNLFGTYTAVAGLAEGFTDKFTQEIRLASEGKRTLEWLVGAFYTKENSDYGQQFLLRDTAGALAPNTLYDYDTPTHFEEVAGFGDLTWHLSDAFDMTAGVRYASNKQDFTQLSRGLFPPPADKVGGSEDVFTYLFNARYHFDERSTLYARYATGYRPGGPNVVSTDPLTGEQIGLATFDADRLKSYEVGYKVESQDRRFALDVAGYLIDWDDIHVSVVQGGFSAIANAAGGARIYGSELSLSYMPLERLTLAGALAYQDARLLDAEPALGASKDERLPNVPEFTVNLKADYEFSSGGDLRPTVGASFRHVDERMASFDGSTGYVQYRLPAYTTIDLRAGMSVRNVDLQLYVRNLLSERGELSAYNWRGTAMPALLQPMTIGVNATTRF